MERRTAAFPAPPGGGAGLYALFLVDPEAGDLAALHFLELRHGFAAAVFGVPPMVGLWIIGLRITGFSLIVDTPDAGAAAGAGAAGAAAPGRAAEAL